MKRINITYTAELTAARNHAADVIADIIRNAAETDSVETIIANNAERIADIADDNATMTAAERNAITTIDNSTAGNIASLFAMNNAAAVDLFADNAEAGRNNADVTDNNARAYIAAVRHDNAVSVAECIAAVGNDSKSVPVIDNDSLFDIAVIIAVNTARNMYRNFGGNYAAELYAAVINNTNEGQDLISVGYTALMTARRFTDSNAVAIRVAYKAVNSFVDRERTAASYDISRISQAAYIRALNGDTDTETGVEDNEPAAAEQDTLQVRIARDTLRRIAEKVELSKKQKEIIAMTASGYSTRDIAAHYSCDHTTILRNLRFIREKCENAGVNVGLDSSIYKFAIERKERAERELNAAYSDVKGVARTHKNIDNARAEYDRHMNRARELNEQANNTPDVVTYKFDRAAVDNAAERFDNSRERNAELRAIDRAFADNIPANATHALRAVIINRAANAATLDRMESVTPAAIINSRRNAARNAAATMTAERVSVEKGEKASHAARRNKTNAARNAARTAVDNAAAMPSFIAVDNAADIAAEREKIERVERAEREYNAAHSALHSMRAAQYEAMKTAYVEAHKAEIERAIDRAAARRADYETGNADKRRAAAITGKRITAIRNGNAAAARIALDNARERFNMRNHIRTTTPTPAAIVAKKTTIPADIAAARIAEYNRIAANNTPAALTAELNAALTAERAARNAAKNRNTTRNKVELTAAVDRRRAAAMALYNAANDLYTNCGRNERAAAAELLKLALENI